METETAPIAPAETVETSRKIEATSSIRPCLLSFATVALTLSVLLAESSRINTATATSVLLLSVLVVARLWGTAPALVAAGCASAAYSYYFLPPAGFSIENPNDWVAFAVFTITAVVAGGLWATAEQRRREIERLYQQLEASFERESEAEAARRNERLKAALLDALTHNLRTPLTAIKMAATALIGTEAYDVTDSERELIHVINEEADRLNVFIEGLGSIDGSADPPASLPAVSFEDIISGALAKAESIVREHRVVIDGSGDLPRLHVDRASIIETIYMVIENATKYTPPGSTIRLSTEVQDAHHVRVNVTDDGPGIPAPLRERVFDRFFRIPGGKEVPGSGLGLSIARRLVLTHGGRIWIEEAPSKRGTRVVIVLPAEEAVHSPKDRIDTERSGPPFA